MIFDSHVHIFPYLGGASGYESVADHLADCQRLIQLVQAEPTRSVHGNAVIPSRKLWDTSRPDPSGWLDRNFRVGTFGRFLWEQDGQECYLQLMPPSLEDMESSPDLLLAMMARAGVTKAVIQCGSIYGRLNRFHADLLRERPELRDVFFPLAQVHEDRATDASEIDEFHRAINEDGLRGLWYTTAEPRTFEAEYDPFWREVEQSGVPVFFDFYPSWADGVRRMAPWRSRFPRIPVILPQSFPTGLDPEPGELVIPEELVATLSEPNTWVEVAIPIARGGVEAYPYASSQKAVRRIYETLGPDRMVWGSDAPNVERYCTYSQSLDYLETYEFIPSGDLAKITGLNLEGIFDRAAS